MRIKVTWFSFSPEQQRRIGELVPEGGWSLLSSTELSGILPERYLAKVDSVIAVSAPTSTGGTCTMFNSLRVDTRTRLVDQDPLGMFVASTGVTASGVLIHHGDWDDRSWEASSAPWGDVADSGVGKYFLSNPPTGQCSGSLADLPKGNTGALERVLEALRARKSTSLA